MQCLHLLVSYIYCLLDDIGPFCHSVHLYIRSTNGKLLFFLNLRFYCKKKCLHTYSSKYCLSLATRLKVDSFWQHMDSALKKTTCLLKQSTNPPNFRFT